MLPKFSGTGRSCAVAWTAAFCGAISATLFAQGKPVFTLDEDCSAFDIAPDNRTVCAARRLMRQGPYTLERDDIWVAGPGGKSRRIVDGEKLVASRAPYSYAIQRITWSPDGQRLAVEMATSQVVDQRGTVKEGQLVDLMDGDGREIKIEGTKASVIEGAYDATWLGDGQTVVFLTEAVKPRLLYQIGMVRPMGGRGGPMFGEHAFAGVAWDARRNRAIALERDRALAGPSVLVELDLLKESRKEIATLAGFAGELSISPSGSKVAYFRDGDTLEIRELEHPEKAVGVTAAYGHYEWSKEERKVLLKRGPAKKSGDLVWLSIPDGQVTPILHDLFFHDFEISPDGNFLGITQPGKRALMVYPLPE